MKKITPFLWFETQAEEAAKFYTTIFPNSKILNISRYDEAGAKAAGRSNGSAMVVSFEINGEEFNAINGGPQFKFTEAISFVISCENQEEVDTFWTKLTEGGQESQCGWLKDKFGLSWQVVPTALGEMLSDSDPKKSENVMKAMLQMKKIEIPTLQQAYNS